MCCLFGLIDYGHSLSKGERNRILTILSTACEVRGTDATGIAYHSRGQLHIYKRPRPAHAMHWRIPGDAWVVMGHTRMTTQGSENVTTTTTHFWAVSRRAPLLWPTTG